jgi:diguanylate cyclase (GGDEF)-like protein
LEIVLYLEINLLCTFVSWVLIRSVKQSSSSTLHERLLITFLKLIIVVVLADCITRVTDGRVFFGSRLLGNVSNFMVFSAGSAAAMVWLLYVECRVRNDADRLRRHMMIYCIPAVFVAIASLLSPSMHLIYYLDADCVYHRGPLFPLQVVGEACYLLGTVIVALRGMKSEHFQARRQEYRVIALFGLMPILGSLLETIWYGLPTAWPFTSCAMLIVVMNIQKNQMAADALTGINNRGRLDQYLAEQSKEFDRYQTLYMILMDVDHFKEINDTYGHTTGDMALIRVAEALKRATAKSGDFVARYGGDEFSVICRRRSDEEVENIEKLIRQEIRENNEIVGEDEPQLALSMGFAALPRGGEENAVEQLIANADAKMYEVKRLRHAMERWGNNQKAEETAEAAEKIEVSPDTADKK